jgi:branched-chain amino acid transport system ATP-binding protein
MNTSSNTLLDIIDLEVYVGAIRILREINLYVKKGEIVGLLGRNGAGKTTTIKAIIGLRKVIKGKIIFDGRDITNLSPEKRIILGIGYQPEDIKIFPDLTVKENLDVPMIIRNIKDRDHEYERIFKILPEIKDLLHRKGSQLSGGQRKMIALGRALAYNPKLLLLDEPFEGLAPVVVSRLFKAFYDIKQEGISILYAESNIRTMSIADRIYVIERGEIIFQGTYEELINNEKVLRVVGR